MHKTTKCYHHNNPWFMGKQHENKNTDCSQYYYYYYCYLACIYVHSISIENEPSVMNYGVTTS